MAVIIVYTGTETRPIDISTNTWPSDISDWRNWQPTRQLLSYIEEASASMPYYTLFSSSETGFFTDKRRFSYPGGARWILRAGRFLKLSPRPQSHIKHHLFHRKTMRCNRKDIGLRIRMDK